MGTNGRSASDNGRKEFLICPQEVHYCPTVMFHTWDGEGAEINASISAVELGLDICVHVSMLELHNVHYGEFLLTS